MVVQDKRSIYYVRYPNLAIYYCLTMASGHLPSNPVSQSPPMSRGHVRKTMVGKNNRIEILLPPRVDIRIKWDQKVAKQRRWIKERKNLAPNNFLSGKLVTVSSQLNPEIPIGSSHPISSVMYNHEYWGTMQVDGFEVIHPNSVAFPHQDGVACFHYTHGLGMRRV